MKPITVFSGFSVGDLAASKAFYSDVLGLEVVDEGIGLKLILPGGEHIFVYPKTNHVPATFTILNLEVEDIDVAVKELSAHGVHLERYEDSYQDDAGIMRGRSVQRGPDIAWFKDPSGNVMAVLQS